MADAPIGIFDSGLGGLTIVKAIQQAMPGEAVVYFGDTAHLPYGDKTPELIRRYSRDITRFLIKKGVKAIVIACNTASAVAYDVVLNEAGKIPVFEVIGPAVREAKKQSRSKNVGVIGTRTTIASGVYRRRLKAVLPDVVLTDKATPLLVPMIEEGWLRNQVSQDVIDAYMSDTGFAEIDTLILGCTHYPLIKHQIEKYFEENHEHSIAVIDSSIEVAETLKHFLAEHGLTNTGTERKSHFFLTDYSAHFRETAGLFLGETVWFEKVE
jgi:glutamate racemase